MNPSTAQARALVAALAKHGVAHVVLSPGSRNAPLSIALAQQQVIRLHVRIDERTAAFTALGIARASGQPAAVVCTSGTAVANLAPALFEADADGVPLLALTADRPPGMRERGANQALDQVGIFANAVRAQWDLPIAADQPAQYWELAIANAVAAAMGDAETAPGPVHLNLPFAEPLVPDAQDDANWQATMQLGRAETAVGHEPLDLGDLLTKFDTDPTAPRGVVIVSDPRSARGLTALARMLQWPVLAEPGAGPRAAEVGIQHYARLLKDAEFAAAHRPDVVITGGRFALARSVAAFIRSAQLHIAIGRPPLDADPFSTASARLPTAPLPLRVGVAPAEWLTSWQQADAAVAQREADWDSRAVARILLSTLTDQDQLWAAASQTVRIIDDLLPVGAPAPRVLVNRGVNGIDGLVAAATGAALAGTAARTVLLLGDIAALHDLSSFVLPDSEPRPNLQIVVLDNRGGAIFRGLEQGAERFSEVFDRVFGTPTSAAIAAAAAALGWSSLEVSDRLQLQQALQSDVQVIVAKLPKGE